MNKIVKVFIFVLILLTLTSCGPNLISIGERAPNFTLRNLEGEEVSLKDNRGKAVLLNFWGAWCPPCTIEMPDIINRSERYKDELVVMAVNYGDSLNTVIDFTEEIGMPFSPLLDLTGDVQDLYIIDGYPTSIFIDKDGVIQMVHIGYLYADVLDEYLEMIGIGEGSNN
jgi:peroxiredoxin